MSVQSIRFKLILCLCMIFPPLLLSYSNAFPDLTFYNNYLTGISPYYAEGTALDGSSIYFYPNEGQDNNYTSVVTSFSTQFMHGTSVPSAIPFLDLDYTKGKVWKLPSGGMVVVGSKSGDIDGLWHTAVDGSNGNLQLIYLGTSHPFNKNYKQSVAVNNNYVYNTAGESFSDYNLYNSNANTIESNLGDIHDFYLYGRVHNSYNSQIVMNSPTTSGNFSFYVLLYNGNTEDILFSVDGYQYLQSHQTVTYDAPYMDSSYFTGMVYAYTYYNSNTSETHTLYSFMPHIQGDIDIYNISYNGYTLNDLETKATYKLSCTYALDCFMYETVESYLAVGIDTPRTQSSRQQAYTISYLHLPGDRDDTLMPIFLNNTSLYYLYNKAIYIKDGYININNYDDLISKLEESGIGTTDLSRVIALLEVINSGGETGEATKQLMDIIEGQHNGVVQHGDNDWTTINNTYNQIKHWLDFSGDTIHWIVTANNALFNYFSGFILLCAFFLVIDRLMKG